MKYFIFLIMMLFICMQTKSLYAKDARVQEIHYNPKTIVKINGQNGIQTMLIFAENERIENIAVGDSAAWQVTPNKRANRLFVKPTMSDVSTNLTVITDRREYLFELNTRRSNSTPLYRLEFIYPKEPEKLSEVAETKPAADAAVIPAKPKATELNFGWTPKGSKNLFPSRIFDDGQFVYLQWNEDVIPPAIFELQADGVQSPLNQSVQDGYVVIDHVPEQLMLRLGKKYARLSRSHSANPSPNKVAATAQEAGTP